jgi:tetratricopeptide (TPR) repeat protein
MMPRTAIAALAALALVPFTVGAQAPDGHAHDHAGRQPEMLGSVAFANSGAPGAQAAFLRGVALLHSFEYSDAGDAFADARRADPEFALAYWMEALTTEHPLWGESDVTRARETLSLLAPTAADRLAKAATPRERSYGAAVEALFAVDDRSARLLAYSDSMRGLPALYPDDLEASAFAAVASLVAAYERGGETRTRLIDEAIERGEKVFALNKQHPGAAHYLIHAFDHPLRAARGLPFARAYAQIAPDAEHALHMPSHIFVQVGMWDDAVASNERAWAASRAWVERRGLSGRHLDFHSLQWLQYGYLQQGRYHEAAAIIDTARLVLAATDDDRTGGPDPLTVVARLAFQYAAETGDWSGMDFGPVVDVLADGDSPRHQFFARVDRYQRTMADLMRNPTAAVAPDSGEGLIALHTRALGARAAGDTAQWISLLRRAVETEERSDPTGPPLVLVSHELLADALLQSGNPNEATELYLSSLVRRPNRASALLGLARARLACGDSIGAEAAYAQLLSIWPAGDADMIAIAEARNGVL